ncbi:similar to Saccharomyces cerevisiae YGR043C NQM1 Transaldolase of unknown function [Maudiozyma saulgeensis]|uniref:Transaldolase n=1 Tax=Maudiozyma saulgeensis TaxID=1789683 RepID=A0A1X7QYZ8_9SACH|nr:similar to Saccharomyces cerevisiae YGR043C NQM1 Transaldolase of unknown function [Kazachstania saulgeensis]
MLDKMSTLDQLRYAGTTIVCDTGNFESIGKYNPQSCTTNPALILAAAQDDKYKEYVKKSVLYGKETGATDEEKIEIAIDTFFVEIGCKILEVVPGRVSTEVDARLSFNKKETIRRAIRIIGLYEQRGYSKDRVLIKIASTWEGIQAAKELEDIHNIHCNLTLLFSLTQAVACAEANVTLISPFVGRIMDFFKAKSGKTFTKDDDPGILAVKEIFYYYKKHNYKTIVMGTCFRNNEELLSLAGIDSVTLPLDKLEELSTSHENVQKVLTIESSKERGKDMRSYISNEAQFRFDMNENAMATDKLSEGIRKFSGDNASLENIFRNLIIDSN